MLISVINTYKCLLGLLEEIPGIPLGTAFPEETIKTLEEELKYLQELFQKEYIDNDNT